MEEITRDEVLTLLDAHCGGEVSACVEMLGPTPTLVMGSAGRLVGWREEFADVAAAALDDAQWRAQLPGHYVVEQAEFNVPDAGFERGEVIYDGVRIHLRGGACLVVRW